MRILLLLALTPASAFACAMPYRPPPQVVAEAPKPAPTNAQAALDPAAVQAAQAAQLKAIMAEIDSAMNQAPAPSTIPEVKAPPSS